MENRKEKTTCKIYKRKKKMNHLSTNKKGKLYIKEKTIQPSLFDPIGMTWKDYLSGVKEGSEEWWNRLRTFDLYQKNQ